ncbi:Cdc6/Cdc18 family protein [Halomarina oriensis]|uniref:ORC1-type DNA replication protein n=1 Tax=Halomarina oriensis TaxID=671145 RepID=A0A6B0GKY2_9EURY|nr:orc1/cdc6 family replication initiation protein [Halomarina oriensis]MWG33453.1 AAA family ATPase [Halomarina oriensis]
MADDDSEGRDPLFRYDDPIFEKQELLEISHVPGPDRIVGRETEMGQVAEALNPAIFGNQPSNLFIFGKTGTGKSLVSRSVTERVVVEAEREEISVRHVFIDCGEQSTEVSVVKTIAQQLNDEHVTGLSVPDRGLGTGDYYKRLWQVIDTFADVLVVILDEIDMLDDDEVLRKLSRAGENRSLSSAKVSVIGISNKIDYPENLSERVKSSLAQTELVFQPYDAEQLKRILEKRRDAFRKGVLGDSVIPLTAALAAGEHGDARKAIDILHNAGLIAKKQSDEMVREDHVRAGKEQAEADRFSELVGGAPTQVKAVLYALVLLTEQNDEAKFSTSRIYDVYSQVRVELNLDELSERRVQELLKEQNFLNVIRSDRTSRGRGGGVYATHRLLEDPDIVKRVLLRDDRLATEL